MTIQPKFGAISMAEFSRQEMPLEGSYIAPLMSIFDVQPLDGEIIFRLLAPDYAHAALYCSKIFKINLYVAKLYEH